MFIDESQITALERRIMQLENKANNSNYEMQEVIRNELKSSINIIEQAETQFGMYTALCIETIDIWKQNKIRFYSPLFHRPDRPIKEFPWADAISSMEGFDDSGLTWIPPAGSTVCIAFENGNRA